MFCCWTRQVKSGNFQIKKENNSRANMPQWQFWRKKTDS